MERCGGKSSRSGDSSAVGPGTHASEERKSKSTTGATATYMNIWLGKTVHGREAKKAVGAGRGRNPDSEMARSTTTVPTIPAPEARLGRSDSSDNTRAFSERSRTAVNRLSKTRKATAVRGGLLVSSQALLRRQVEFGLTRRRVG